MRFRDTPEGVNVPNEDPCYRTKLKNAQRHISAQTTDHVVSTVLGGSRGLVASSAIVEMDGDTAMLTAYWLPTL